MEKNLADYLSAFWETTSELRAIYVKKEQNVSVVTLTLT